MHLVNWREMKKPLKEGGLGIRSILHMNRALCMVSGCGDF